MTQLGSNVCEQLAQAAKRFQELSTGHAPSSVTVVHEDDTLVFTLHDALTPVEKVLAESATGAARVQDFHRQLFADSNGELRDEITRITGRHVREAAAEIDPTTGTVVHVFTSGEMVHVFLLSPCEASDSANLHIAIQRADNEGFGSQSNPSSST